MNTRFLLLTLLTTVGLAGPILANAQEMKTAVNPKHLPNTTQYGYSQATVVAPNAKVIYVAGQIGITDEGPNDFEHQVDRSFENMIAALEAAGGRVEDVVKITILIKDYDEEKLKYLVSKRRQVFGNNPPASILIPVPRLALDSLKFEIDAVAVAPE
jgi:enamine deaminase RidA (YjgF/YER057c/UK114 family)